MGPTDGGAGPRIHRRVPDVHCGWNSTLESLVHGMSMVEWLLYIEQRLNTVMLVGGMGAAIRLLETMDKEAITVAVRVVMVGKGRVPRCGRRRRS